MFRVTDEDQLSVLTTEEVAALLKVHRQTVLRWLNSGELRGVRLGGTKAGWRIDRRDLEEFWRQLRAT